MIKPKPKQPVLAQEFGIVYFFLYSAYIHTSSTIAYIQSAHIQTIIEQTYIGTGNSILQFVI